jgi:hypothetical protein
MRGREVGVRCRVARRADRDDLAVGLKGERVASFVPAREIDGDLAVEVESRVGRAVHVEPSDEEVVAGWTAGADGRADQDLAVRLHDGLRGQLETCRREARQREAAGAECRIEIAVGGDRGVGHEYRGERENGRTGLRRCGSIAHLHRNPLD